MLIELALEFVERGEAIECRLEATVRVLEMPPPESLQRLPLLANALELLGAAEFCDAIGEFAVDEKVGYPVLALARLYGLLELPFGAGDRAFAGERFVFTRLGARRQRRPKARPQDQHNDVGG